MSTLAEIKAAVEALPAEDRYEFLHWLASSEEMRQRDLEELRACCTVAVI